MDIELVPVCSPHLMAEGELGRKPAQWARATRLMSHARPQDWETWANAAGVNIDPAAGMRFESSSLAYQAAMEGIGVAIAMKGLVQEDLDTGRLVIAHPAIHPTGFSFYLTYSPAAAEMQQVREFRDWILAEAEGVKSSLR
jgi:LysR family glycine cleavage system transcriptional activator